MFCEFLIVDFECVCVSSSSHPHLKHCACFVITEKTTVCRIFSCQRSLGEPSLRRILIALTRSAFRRLAPFARGRLLSLAPKLLRSTDVPIERNHQVENTGLEPVTSWLQTRRSPS